MGQTQNFQGKEMDASLRNRKVKKKKWKKVSPLSSTPYIVVTKMNKKENEHKAASVTSARDKEFPVAHDAGPAKASSPKHLDDFKEDLNCVDYNIFESNLCADTRTEIIPSTMDLVMDDPNFLIDWEVFVEGYGFGYCIDGAKSRDKCPEVTVKVRVIYLYCLISEQEYYLF